MFPKLFPELSFNKGQWMFGEILTKGFDITRVPIKRKLVDMFQKFRICGCWGVPVVWFLVQDFVSLKFF
jgi:hypothetical protein